MSNNNFSSRFNLVDCLGYKMTILYWVSIIICSIALDHFVLRACDAKFDKAAKERVLKTEMLNSSICKKINPQLTKEECEHLLKKY
jgi:hypothetical protein